MSDFGFVSKLLTAGTEPTVLNRLECGGSCVLSQQYVAPAAIVSKRSTPSASQGTSGCWRHPAGPSCRGVSRTATNAPTGSQGRYAAEHGRRSVAGHASIRGSRTATNASTRTYWPVRSVARRARALRDLLRARTGCAAASGRDPDCSDRYNSSALITPEISPTLENLAKKQGFVIAPKVHFGGALHLFRFYPKPLISRVSQKGRGGRPNHCRRCISSAEASPDCRTGVATLPAKRCISPWKCHFSQ